MIIFVKNRPIYIISAKKAQKKEGIFDFDRIIDTNLNSLKITHLQGHLMLLNATSSTVTKLFEFLLSTTLPDLHSVTVVSNDLSEIEKKLFKIFTVMKAAGGVISKENKYLLMLRRGVWDLPKGKLDAGEKSKTAAIREVFEETGVKAEITNKICTTWHTYKQDGEHILKRTKWYAMTCVDDSAMKPQAEEDIEEVNWLTEHELNQVLQNSFSSIRYVIHTFFEEKMIANT